MGSQIQTVYSKYNLIMKTCFLPFPLSSEESGKEDRGGAESSEIAKKKWWMVYKGNQSHKSGHQPPQPVASVLAGSGPSCIQNKTHPSWNPNQQHQHHPWGGVFFPLWFLLPPKLLSNFTRYLQSSRIRFFLVPWNKGYRLPRKWRPSYRQVNDGSVLYPTGKKQRQVLNQILAVPNTSQLTPDYLRLGMCCVQE